MPAKSQNQEMAAGIALAAKEGKFPINRLRGASKSMYDSMSSQELRKYASTPRKGLPKNVKKK